MVLWIDTFIRIAELVNKKKCLAAVLPHMLMPSGAGLGKTELTSSSGLTGLFFHSDPHTSL